MGNYCASITVSAKETFTNYIVFKKQLDDLREMLLIESEEIKKSADIFSEDRRFINNLYHCYQNRMPFSCNELDNKMDIMKNEDSIQISGEVINYYDVVNIIMNHIRNAVDDFVLRLASSDDACVTGDVIKFIKKLCEKGKDIIVAREAFYLTLCIDVDKPKKEEQIYREKEECLAAIEEWNRILETVSNIKLGAIAF